MDSGNTYKYITTAGTYVLYGNEMKKVVLHGIEVNQILTGTLTVMAGATVIGIMAAGTPIGSYWISTNGIQIESANIVTSANENVTVIYTNIG
jgi:hypothetical protein